MVVLREAGVANLEADIAAVVEEVRTAAVAVAVTSINTNSKDS